MKKKALYKKWMSMLLAGVVTTTGFMGGTVTLRAAETTNWVGDENLTGNAEAPAKDKVVPDKNQFRYQKEELAAFCHFGPNTFNEIEWGEHYGDKKPSEIFTLKQDFDAETLVKTLKDAGFKKLIVTAKHHDGFCIWDSEHTEYDVAASGIRMQMGSQTFWQRYPKHVQIRIWIWDYICLRGIFMMKVMDIMMKIINRRIKSMII